MDGLPCFIYRKEIKMDKQRIEEMYEVIHRCQELLHEKHGDDESKFSKEDEQILDNAKYAVAVFREGIGLPNLIDEENDKRRIIARQNVVRSVDDFVDYWETTGLSEVRIIQREINEYIYDQAINELAEIAGNFEPEVVENDDNQLEIWKEIERRKNNK
tara:strand:+ start:639 stop:1115 length:477 start_codon:yes stop_codon:yes gene_type:complete